MFMKKKIRKAFQNATPDVLSRAMQELPRGEKAAAAPADPRAMLSVEKQRGKKERFQEFLATAAALALLIGACGAGAWYFVQNPNGGHSGLHGTTAPEPTRVALEPDDFYYNRIEAAKNCVEPSDRDNITPTGEYYRTEFDGATAYVVSVEYKGYLYELTFAEEGELLELAVPQTDSIKDDEYITESAVSSIAYTQVDDSMAATNFAWFRNGIILGENGDGKMCYYVTLVRHPINDYNNNEYKTFCISAYTGQILDVQGFYTAEHSGIVSDLSVQKTLWQLVSDGNTDIPMYQWLDYTTSSTFIREGDLFYRITFTYEGYEYVFETDRTGKRVSIDISATEDCKPGDVISKGVAMEIACLTNKLEIGDGEKLQISLDNGVYTIVHKSTADSKCYYVDAHTGQCIEEVLIGPLVYEKDTVTYLWSRVLDDFDSVDDEYRESNTTITDMGIRDYYSIYKIEITHGGYWYIFEVDRLGTPLSIEIPMTDSIKDGYISQSVAEDIVYLAHSDAIGGIWTVHTTLVDKYYQITYSNNLTGEKISCTVNAYTGEIVEDSVLSLAAIRDIALSYHDISLDYCHSLVMEYENKGTASECIRVSAACRDALYVATIQTSNSEIIDDYVLMTELPNYYATNGMSSVIYWDKARDAALEALEIELDALTGISISFDLQQRLYWFTFESGDQEISCTVYAGNGQVITDGLISPTEAWEVMLAQVSEKTREAYLAGALKTGIVICTDVERPYYELWLTDDAVYVAQVDAATGELIDFYGIVDEIEPDGDTSSDDDTTYAQTGEEAMLKAFIKHYNVSVEYQEDIYVEYLTCQDDVHVGFIHGYLMVEYAMCSDNIGGLSFNYYDSQRLLACRDGELLELSEAYDAGWFTEEGLEAVHGAYRRMRPNLYNLDPSQYEIATPK